MTALRVLLCEYYSGFIRIRHAPDYFKQNTL